MRITSAATARETVQSVRVVRFPHLLTEVWSKPGTGGRKSRNATKAAIKAIVTANAILLQDYHSEISVSTQG